MVGEIVHTRPSINFDRRAVSIRPLLFPAVAIPWEQIEYISPTPEYELIEGTWVSRAAAGCEVPKDADDLELRLMAKSAFVPAWMLFPWGPIFAQPLYDADDRLRPDCRVVVLELNIARLSAPVTEFFDLLSENCRFDLIVTD